MIKVNNDKKEEFEKKFSDFVKEPKPELKNELILIYQKMTNYKSYCAYCIFGKKLFVKGLDRLIEGEENEGLLLVSRAFDHAKIKNNMVNFLTGLIK